MLGISSGSMSSARLRASADLDRSAEIDTACSLTLAAPNMVHGWW